MKQITGYCMIQTAAVNANTWAVARLYNGATKSPAGYIVGSFDIVADGLDEKSAREKMISLPL